LAFELHHFKKVLTSNNTVGFLLSKHLYGAHSIENTKNRNKTPLR